MEMYATMVERMLNPKRILVTKFRAMGDTILLTAALKAIHEEWPQAQIHVAVTEPWVWLLDGFPGVTRLWPVTWHADRAARTKAATRLAFQLRKEKYDLVFGFHSSPAAAMVALSTGAKTRSIHFHSFKAKNMYSTVTVPGKGTMKPVVERDLDTVRAVGIDVPTGIMPEVYLKDEERRFAREEFQAWGLKSPVLGIALGASRPTKVWPLHRFAELAQRWVKLHGSVLVIAGPGEEALHEEFFRSIPNDPQLRDAIKVMPVGNVRSLAARISQLNVLVGNDSGPRHLATALNIPTVTIFGPEHPLEWHPYPQDRHPRLFVEPLPCRVNTEPGSPPWCGLYECIIESHQCMTRISTDEVFEQIARVYEQHGRGLRIAE
jgi:ADP-heptose:LPS heptosyltransferase